MKSRPGFRLQPDEIIKETSRQYVFAITGRKFSGLHRFKKGFYDLANIPTIFQKLDQTLETPHRLSCTI